MPLLKWIFVGLLLLPIGEVAVFLVMAAIIGWLWTVGLFLGTSLLGALILRRSGRENLARFVAALHQEGLRAIHLESPGFAAILGGILLVLPGFITDLVGVLLFLPPLRRWAAARIGRSLRSRRRAKGDRSMIELEPGEWHQISETAIADGTASKRPRRIRRKRQP